MRTSIILILTLGLMATLTWAQSGWPSPATFPQSSYSQPSPYRGPSPLSIPSSPAATIRLSSPGQYQSGQWSPGQYNSGQYQADNSGQYRPSSPALSTLSSIPAYNRPALPSSGPFQASPSPWAPSAPAGNRGWSIPSAPSSFASFPQPPSAGYQSYARPATVAAPQAAQVSGTPFQSSWSINHQAAAPVSQPAPLSLPAQSYSPPSAPAQSWSPPSPPAQSWSPPPASLQTYRAPAPATQWRAPAPVQTYTAPAPATQWRAPAAQPAPAPQPVSSYTSPQNSQNLRPAPVHYASIGADLAGDYKFGYHTGDGGSFREETRLPDGTVQGAYGFIDADGKQRIVKYKAGKDGFQAEGDDVPKGSPVAPTEGAAPVPQAQPSAPIKFEEGAAFRSFSQG